MSRLGLAKGGGALLLLTLIVFLPALRADFIWDDDLWLWENKVIADGGHWSAYWLGDRTPDYLPVTSTVFWYAHRAFGRDATGYHVINVLLHTLGAVLLWRLLMRLGMDERTGWVAAAIFAVHPLNVSSVAWITELKNTLSLPLYVLAILAYMQFEKRPRPRWFVASLVLFALGLLSKPSGILLPLLIPAVRLWKRQVVRRVDLMRMAAFAALSVLIAIITLQFQHHRAIADAVVRPEGFVSRLAAAGWAVWFYLYKTLLPLDLTMIYPRWRVDTASPVSYLPLLALIVVFAALWRFRDRIGRAPLFVLGYYVAALAPVLGLVAMAYHRYSLVADHWQYLAMPALAGLAAGVGRLALADHVRARLPVAATVVVVLGALSFNHARHFADPFALWSDNVRKVPQCAAAQADLGLLLVERGQYEQAVAHLRMAVEHEPDDARHWMKLGVALSAWQKPAPAARSLRRAVSLDGDSLDAHRQLAHALMQTRQYAQAAQHYAAAAKLAPNSSQLTVRQADALAKAGREDDAIALLEDLMKRMPFWPDATDMLARILARHRDPERAVTLAERACDMTRHKRPRFIHTLAIAYAAMGNQADARRLAQLALQLARQQDKPKTAGEIEAFLAELAP